MNDFPDIPIDISGGQRDLLFAIKEHVKRLPVIDELICSGGVVMEQWMRFFKMPHSFNSLKFKETKKTTAAGKYYEREVSLFIPGNTIQVKQLLEEIAERKFILDITDNNDKRFLVGTKEEPMSISFDYNGAQLGKVAGHTISFKGKGRYPSPYYQMS